MDKYQSQPRRELSVKTRELEKAEKRLGDLDKLFRKAFEQLALENLSEAQFKALNADRFMAIVVHERSERWKNGPFH